MGWGSTASVALLHPVQEPGSKAFPGVGGEAAGFPGESPPPPPAGLPTSQSAGREGCSAGVGSGVTSAFGVGLGFNYLMISQMDSSTV